MAVDKWTACLMLLFGSVMLPLLFSCTAQPFCPSLFQLILIDHTALGPHAVGKALKTNFTAWLHRCIGPNSHFWYITDNIVPCL